MKTMLAMAAIAAAVLTVPAKAQEAGIELGMLDCVVEGGTGFIVGSTKDVRCTYQPADAALAPEVYFGSINKFGIDIGFTEAQMMQWLVLGPNNNVYAPGALAGDYVGATAEATAVVGVGANVLVGGLDRTFTLQPVSVQTQTGLNLAVGVAEFQIRTAQ